MSSIADLLAQIDLPDSATPVLDAQLLLAHALGKPRSYLSTWPEREPDSAQLAAYEQLMARRRQGEPVAYLLGQQGFWSLDLQVSPATLIPARIPSGWSNWLWSWANQGQPKFWIWVPVLALLRWRWLMNGVTGSCLAATGSQRQWCWLSVTGSSTVLEMRASLSVTGSPRCRPCALI